jgi:hypothetical protein
MMPITIATHTTTTAMMTARLAGARFPDTNSSVDCCAKAWNLAVFALGSLSVSGMRATLTGQDLATGGEEVNSR